MASFPDESQNRSSFEDAQQIIPAGPAQLPRNLPAKIARAQGDPGTDTSAFEDGYALLDSQVLPSQQVTPFEDGLVAYLQEVDDFSYAQGQLDDDGKELLQGAPVQAVFRYDSTQDQFGQARTPGDGFYGADRSGDLFNNGEACAFGDFGELGTGIRGTAWAASYLDPLGLPGQTMVPVLQANDDILFTTDGPLPGAGNAALNSSLKWYLEDDFQLDVDFKDIAFNATNTTDCGVFYEVKLDSNTRAQVGRIKTNTQEGIRSTIFVNGVQVDTQFTSLASTSGSFRFTRSGSDLAIFYDVGGGFVQLGGSVSFTASRLYVQVSGQGPINADFQGAFTNVTLQSGSTVSKVGWFQEAGGAHRGNNPEFPAIVSVIATQDDISIIDEQNDLLWMRFVKLANNAYPVFTLNTIATGVKFKAGVLLVSLSGQSGSAEGGVMRVDFTQDEVRIHRADSSTITGGKYIAASGAVDDGRSVAVGHLIERNNNRSYGGDFTQWNTTPAIFPCNDAALVHDLDLPQTEFRAAATQAGITLYKWARWNYAGSNEDNPDTIRRANSNNTDPILWCEFQPSSFGLFYTDRSKLYEITRASYEVRFTGGFGGTWDADTEKTLPGTRSDLAQYSAALVGSDVFVPADQGIYRVEWPSGNFILFFGKPGSGAVHELLEPWHDAVIRLQAAVDGLNSLLLASVESNDTRRSQIVALKLNDNTVYSKTPVKFGRAGTVRTVGS